MPALLHAFQQQENSDNFTSFKGELLDQNTKKPLVSATLTIVNTQLSTVTNNEGEFLLKVPDNIAATMVELSYLGYATKVIELSSLKPEENTLFLTPVTTQLNAVSLTQYKDARGLVEQVFNNKSENYLGDQALMTAFYRESIKKRNRNVSLAEAVVNIKKEPYETNRKDIVSLYKSRKSTDYTRLDTVAVKLQGGPFNALYIDLMKYPEYFLGADGIDNYDFSIVETTEVNGIQVVVVDFKQKSEVDFPLYYGQLFINPNTLALTNASYSLNLEDETKASNLFVRKKPGKLTVIPTVANYQVDYREENGKWYYSYSNVDLGLTIKEKGKLFNSKYYLSSEMVITNIESIANITDFNKNKKFKSRTILADAASGFNDPQFWGEYNVIEPEKSIESAIKKIRRQLKRTGS
ncbi:carboxypeptidase-like regulatory domain-containing protein [Gangjinia marincola]|uniref:Carboxypeptidase-like regulatory domain-containing protein n=2 Tax=Gangjinia marincola TaxID=578463 RepID=A0ABN1MDH8_9FLAO